ncbi:MAG TPA: hypothetical protein VMB26_02665 [Candidatus Binataceae bacterium]|nr:hypothetical protein [Candidatus Binataceae bacterium]
MPTIQVGVWAGDWVWSVPLIVLTVAIHVCGLALIGERVVHVLGQAEEHRRFLFKFGAVMGGTSLLATALHGLEAGIWAFAYRIVDALPDQRSAMLYSLNALTSYGHAPMFLKSKWQLMGALEALNGMLLFGLTTAFLFAMIQRVWPIGSRFHVQEP